MTREQTINYLYSSGMSDEQVKTVCDALKPKWIPCSERLPKFGEVCLLTEHEIGWNGTEYNHVIIGTYNDNYKNHYLAWMPLPEPYKENY